MIGTMSEQDLIDGGMMYNVVAVDGYGYHIHIFQPKGVNSTNRIEAVEGSVIWFTVDMYGDLIHEQHPFEDVAYPATSQIFEEGEYVIYMDDVHPHFLDNLKQTLRNVIREKEIV